MTAIAGQQAAITLPPARFRHTLAAEWAKLFSVRSTYIMLVLGLALSVGMTVLVAFATGATYDDWQPADQADFEPIMFSLVGVVFGRIVYAVLGVLAVTSEYASGMIRLTFTATPRRGRVLAAKALIVTAVLVVASLVMTVTMFVTGQAILASYDMPTASLGDGDALRAVVGIGVLGPFFPLVGLALGFLLRSTAGGITAVLALIWLPEIFGGLLPQWWREHILSLLPGPATDSIAIGHLADSPAYSSPAVGAVISAAWLVIFLGGAFLALRRRDA